MSLIAALQAPPAAAAEKCSLQALEIPIAMRGSRAVATVTINGTEVPLTVDSGAFFSFLTPAVAQQLKLRVGPLPWGLRIEGLTGEVDAGLTNVKEMNLVGGKLPDMDFIVGGNEPGAGTMGILGRNFLAITDIEYDLAHGAIRLMFPKGDCSDMGMAYWAADKPVSELRLLRDDSRSKLPAMQAVVELNGKKLRALFDTGASSLVSLSAAKSLGIPETAMKPAGLSGGAGLGYAKRWTAAFDSFVVGGEKTSNVRIPIVDFDGMKTDMLLGIDFFLSHRIYVSKSQRKMYFTYNGGRVFALSEVAAAAEDGASAPELADADAYARRGAGAASRHDYRAALADLDRALEMEPGNAAVLVQRGEVHEALHQGPEAIADYESALKLVPTQPDALLRRAWFRESQRNRDGALLDIEALDRLLPPQAHQRLQLARLYERMGLQDRVIPQLDQWIAARDQDIEMAGALNSRCWARMLLNTGLDQALKDCDKAIDFEPDNASFRDSRAWVRLRRGELNKALSDFDHALKVKDDLAWARYGRGLVRGRLGKPGDGDADLEAARKVLPTIDERVKRWGLAANPG
ncbi:aspartyl protease family protein [Paucibacter sp. R3-3]|uniref:Aspartyl protease family protein n=1 Tax=Roseateles agri TaxID=3098619 RepID=A0ABU5DH79_9BURK|nr:aspartyl protease family protein [Paucibacter sp. R3-3]MDY0745637.1 aspartyl protease family protein [Paucibacter sp. R3-3]